MKDFELIKKAQKGDMPSFEQLVFRYDRMVINIANSFRSSEEDAKDIYQEVFLRVYKGIKSFKFNSEFSTWIYRITTNVCVSYHNKIKRHVHESLDRAVNQDDADSISFSETIPGEDSTDGLILGGDLQQRIDNALNELPAQQKLAFTLKYYDGFKIREIAGMMNCNEGTIKRYLFTAVNKMRSQLKDLI